MLISTKLTTIDSQNYADALFTATVDNCNRTAQANSCGYISSTAYRLAIASELEALALQLQSPDCIEPDWVYGLFDLAMEHARPHS